MREQASVAVVGAGRMGTALALALAACGGYRIVALVAKRASRARRAAALLADASEASAPTLALDARQLAQLPPVDLLLVTTPDDLIGETALQLAQQLPEHISAPSSSRARRAVVLHASGALSSEALAPLKARGFSIGSLHPLVAVSDALTGAERLRASFFCVEGERVAVRAARQLVRELGARSFSIKTADKPLYHAAAVMTAGHTVALFDMASELLARCGLGQRRSREVLLPLLRSTLDNLATRKTTARALTGSFARGDAMIIRAHLAAFRDAGAWDALAVYLLLGEQSLKLAAQNGVPEQTLELIRRELIDAMGGINK